MAVPVRMVVRRDFGRLPSPVVAADGQRRRLLDDKDRHHACRLIVKEEHQADAAGHEQGEWASDEPGRIIVPSAASPQPVLRITS